MKTILLSLTFIFLFSSMVTAQKKKNKDKKITKTEEEIDVEEVIDVPDEVYFADNSYSSQGTEQRIVDNYYLTKKKIRDYKYNYGIRKGGMIVLPQIFTYATIKNEKVLFTLGNTKGLYDPTKKKWTIPFEYEDIRSINEEVFLVSKNNQMGVIDIDNNLIIPMEWDEMVRLYSMPNYYIVKKELKYGIINIISGKMIIPCEYDAIKSLESQSIFKVTKSNKVNLINIHNELILKNWYDKITTSKRLGYFIVSKDGKMGVINDNEEIIVPINKIFINDKPFSDGSYLVKNEMDKYGFMLIDGTITLPFKYDNLRNKYISNYTKSVLVGQSNKCGIIKVNSGVPYELTTCDYDNVTLANKLYIVQKEGKFGIIDSYAKEVLKMQYSEIVKIGNRYEDNPQFKAKKGNLYYLVLNIGKLATQKGYYSLDFLPVNASYKSTIFYITSNKKGKFGLIDKMGVEILPSEYDQFVIQISNSIIAKKGGKYGVYSLTKRAALIDFKYDLIIYNDGKYYGVIENKYFEISRNGNVKPLN